MKHANKLVLELGKPPPFEDAPEMVVRPDVEDEILSA